MSDGEYWEHFKEEKKAIRDRASQRFEKELQLLNALDHVNILAVEDDGSGGAKYVIEVSNDRGLRKVDWWVRTGAWRVRGGTGKGHTIYGMQKYFKLYLKKEFLDLGRSI